MQTYIYTASLPALLAQNTDFEEDKRLGKGGFGTVFKCRNRLDEQWYAVKKIPIMIKDGLVENREKILREVLALSDMDHQHVVRYFQAWIEDGCTIEQTSSSGEECSSEVSVKANGMLYIQMTFCPQTLDGLLDSYRKSKRVLDTETIWRYFRQITEGVHHVHEKKIVHLDLSRSNIFLDKDNNIQIGDFGLATFLGDTSCVPFSGFGNPLYLAPELKEEGAHVSLEADIFSLGLLLCDLVHQFTTDGERFRVFANLKQGIFPEELEPVKSLLTELLAETPSTRPSASDILQRELPWGEVGLGYTRFLENSVHTLQTKVATLTSQMEELERSFHRSNEQNW